MNKKSVLSQISSDYSNIILALILGIPLYLFSKGVIKWYDLAPMWIILNLSSLFCWIIFRYYNGRYPTNSLKEFFIGIILLSSLPFYALSYIFTTQEVGLVGIQNTTWNYILPSINSIIFLIWFFIFIRRVKTLKVEPIKPLIFLHASISFITILISVFKGVNFLLEISISNIIARKIVIVFQGILFFLILIYCMANAPKYIRNFRF